MAVRARLTPPRDVRHDWPWHTAKTASMRVSLMLTGDRRMEAENYLAGGYSTKIAIESKSAGWKRFAEVARTWQPSRLKGIQVSRDFGTPFLAATQVFDVRPIARKWLSLDRTESSSERFLSPGTIVLTCSGDVGRATMAQSTVDGMLISHDLMRIDAINADWRGWIYAYLRAPSIRAMMKSAQYGHIIKHLETSHINGLPIIDVEPSVRKKMTEFVQKVHQRRNEAQKLTLQAERLFEAAFGSFSAASVGESGFTGKASSLFLKGRRRFDAWHHNPSVAALEAHLGSRATAWESISDLGFKAWLPTRFPRIPADDGVLLVDSSDFFEINPDINKRIADVNFGDPYNGRVSAGWLLLARSGQIYGVNGSVMMSGTCHENKVVSDDIIRIAPGTARCPTGYLLVAMSHPSLGRMRVKALAYGSSIPHIEVADVESFKIPRLGESIEIEIAGYAERASSLRSQADEMENDLSNEAEAHIQRFISTGNPRSR